MQVNRAECAKGASHVLNVRHNGFRAEKTFQFDVIKGGEGDFYSEYSVENLPGFDLAYMNFRTVTPQMIHESFEPQYNLNPDNVIDGYGEPPVETEDISL